MFLRKTFFKDFSPQQLVDITKTTQPVIHMS